MSRAEKFISDYTRNCSNEIQSPYPQIVENICKIGGDPAKEFSPWLTPDQALRAVEIAREEMIEKALTTFHVVCNRPAKLFPNCEAYCNACKQFKQAMKDE